MPGGFSYEMQTVQIDALSNASGSFKRSFEDQETGSIAVDAPVIESKYAAEALDTIFTADVVAEGYEPSKGIHRFTVTYAREVRTLTQGAQDAPLMVAYIGDVSPSSTADVAVAVASGASLDVTWNGATYAAERVAAVAAFAAVLRRAAVVGAAQAGAAQEERLCCSPELGGGPAPPSSRSAARRRDAHAVVAHPAIVAGKPSDEIWRGVARACVCLPRADKRRL